MSPPLSRNDIEKIKKLGYPSLASFLKEQILEFQQKEKIATSLSSGEITQEPTKSKERL
jgi:hypothetical protein